MLRNTTLISFLAAFAAAACGGQVLGGDGGTSNGDGSTTPTPTTSTSSNPPPNPVDAGQPPPLCTPMSGGGTVGTNGTCSVNESWSCGATKYTVDCNCGGSANTSQCSCSEFTSNGGSGTVVTYAGCPGCTMSGNQLAQLCGFPSN